MGGNGSASYKKIRDKSFFNSKAFDSIVNSGAISNSSDEDTLLNKILEFKHFDGKPRIVSKAVLDDLVSKGNTELFRGVADKAHAEQLKYGKLFTGSGAYGSGIYTAFGEDGKTISKIYSKKGGVQLRMVLDKNAKIADYTTLTKQMHKESSKYSDSTNEDYMNKMTKHQQKEVDAIKEISYNNVGRYAALKGYDAIKNNGGDEFIVVLNRTKLTIQK